MKKPALFEGYALAGIFVFAATGAAQAQEGFQFFEPPEEQGITGVYWIQSYSPGITTAEGDPPPYNEEAQGIYDERAARIQSSAEIIGEDQARLLCTPDGIPRAVQSPYPFEIVQTEGKIHILYEINKIIRLIHMDEPLPDDDYLTLFPYYSGHSVGRWEGDTLIIETSGFKDYTFIDNLGGPHSQTMRVTERYRKINDGAELELNVDISDPNVFTEDWSARFVYDSRPDIRIMDWNCGEQHRDISGVPGVVIPE